MRRPADTRNSLEHARNVFAEALRREPAGPYADHYRRALANVDARLQQMGRGQ